MQKPEMKPDDQPTIVSLEQHRRRRQDEARKKQQRAAANARRAPVAPANRAINWRRLPAFLAALALLVLFMWGVTQIGALIDPFH